MLTKESKVPLKNTEEYVNRPAEQRVADLGKRKSIPRPMNSFMLYRSAYTERAKEWCDRNNHQIVSKIAGQSWALESPEIRERFAELARIERDNHQAAHPNYKFQPSKASAGMKKPRGAHSDLLGDDASETNESDLDWSPHGHKRPRQRSQRRDDYGSPLGLGGNLYESPTYNRILQRGLNRSQFRASNPTQQLPMPMGAMGRNGEYLSRHVYPTVTGGTRVEDVAYHSTPIPGGPMMLERAAAQSQHEMVPMHAPIAGIAHNDLLVMDEAREQADQAGGHNIDPLLGANDGFHGSLNAESFEQWEDNNLSQLISDNQADIELKNYDFQAGGDIHAYDPFQGGPGGLPE